MFPFAFRSLYETLQVFAGIAERQQRQIDFADDGFQLFPDSRLKTKYPGGGLPIKKWKMYSDPRDLEELDFIVSHVSAVKGGFGVSKSAVRRWLKVLDDPWRNLDPWIFSILSEAGVLNETGDLISGTTPLLAKRLALWERYRASVPYHQIGAANGDNLANRPLRHRTWHGSLGNFGAGWALDVGASQDLEDWHIETGRASLSTLCGRILEVSPKARASGIRIAPHRAFSPSRRGDTGANVHREIVIPTSKSLDCLEIDYTMKKGKGLPIPNSWDPSALYDHRGRLLPPRMEEAA